MYAHTEDNVAMLDELALRQDQLQIYHSRRQIAESAEVQISTILVCRDTCWTTDESNPQSKMQMLKTVAEWCYLHVVHRKKSVHVSYTENSLNDWLYAPVASKKKPLQQNAFCDIQSVTDAVCHHVKIGPHRLDIHESRSQNQWNLLLWRASVTKVTTCRTSDLCRVIFQ